VPRFRPGSGALSNWRRYSMLGLLGIGMYNSLQYLALQSSTPINVTLVASGMPVWMMLVGRLFFKAPVRRWQVAGAVLSIAACWWCCAAATSASCWPCAWWPATCT
jgi:drug/metabolite transporter (DMT)-like permease